jgi:hypothetical protein
MAKNKKQHYVPKGYFRFFSKDEKINVIKFEDLKVIKEVPIYSQAFEDYFYSKKERLKIPLQE